MSVTIPSNVVKFVHDHGREAVKVERETGLHSAFTLAQAGIESGWGSSAPDNNFHGIKAFKSWTGPRHLSRTWEATSDGVLHLQEGESSIRIFGPTETGNPFPGHYAHRIMAWFRSYPTAYASFMDHAALLQKPRYASAWAVRNNPKKMAVEIMKDGYGTDPNYVPKLHKAIDWVQASAQIDPGKSKRSVWPWLAAATALGLGTTAVILVSSSHKS